MKKVCETFTSGHTMTTLKVKHGLGTKDVIVQAYNADIDENIITDVIVELNSVSVIFAQPPEFSVRVVVIG